MIQDQWTAVDQYFNNLLLPPDPILDAALADSVAADLPPISVAPNQGKLLMLFARMMNAKRILEIGTLGAYSTIWLARGLSAGGRIITLEADPRHAAVARKNLARAKLTDIVDLREGRAIDTLPTLTSEAPFDLIFIDADKPSIADYLTLSVKLSRPGTAIIVDNVVRKGAVIDPASTDVNVQGVRKFASLLASLPNLTATTLQTVGSKGYDGFTLIIVN